MRYASVYLTGGISSMALSFVLMSFQKIRDKNEKKTVSLLGTCWKNNSNVLYWKKWDKKYSEHGSIVNSIVFRKGKIDAWEKTYQKSKLQQWD